MSLNQIKSIKSNHQLTIKLIKEIRIVVKRREGLGDGGEEGKMLRRERGIEQCVWVNACGSLTTTDP